MVLDIEYADDIVILLLGICKTILCNVAQNALILVIAQKKFTKKNGTGILLRTAPFLNT